MLNFNMAADHEAQPIVVHIYSNAYYIKDIIVYRTRPL
jgi:hypothetical protein